MNNRRNRAVPLPPGEGQGEGERSLLPKNLLNKCRQLRRSSTDAEKQLWSCLRDRQLLGFKFRRQHPIGRFILDFYCFEGGLAIELDGGQHAETGHEFYDRERTDALERKGIRVLRFWNLDVLQNLEGTLETIAQALIQDQSLTPALSHREREQED